ncbi:hypothetical protein AA23498_2382 [Acetobacter nitrogenifigens DSM 23921 = NBRC 105050]|uniref:Uncharacterized protein n=1 Tax=Acetobacter nitrogenifigens DSM 23921 = NBRC 105050 TaxID=1120919 RepID=A0A511X7G0_9PROT|nr:hypothetical protein [Acetobacter nitrogenifigens]GBQ95643.1 hypothetical protein AA23498_2382 [Acetobacter nitrogenifigens DSM 23921 = NBRC 105050]GEN58886.1 hypothetical protein ANI02nite_07700 [Acetobacter nitrogenifigens DSM 23921 = NBRC 105050]
MTTTAAISGAGYDLLASRHTGRSSAAPTSLAATGVSVSTRHHGGGTFAMALDAAGRITTGDSGDSPGAQNDSASARLFG